MNIILGGGVVALFARDILGPEWMIIPVGRSIYYSFIPPLADNYIIRDDITDKYLETIVPESTPVLIKNGFSAEGQITQNTSFIDGWLNKKYGEGDVPPQAKSYLSNHMGFWTYQNIPRIYKILQSKFEQDIKNGAALGKPLSIDLKDRIIKVNNQTFEYTNILNTTPLYAFLKLSKIDCPLNHRDMWCYHLRSDKIDLEGCTNIFVVDDKIAFYQATRVGNSDYVFYSTVNIEQPGRYFMQIIEDFDLINETVVPDAIQCGIIPKIPDLMNNGIINLGSGVHDDCLDIGSCIKRLLKMVK